MMAMTVSRCFNCMTYLALGTGTQLSTRDMSGLVVVSNIYIYPMGKDATPRRC